LNFSELSQYRRRECTFGQREVQPEGVGLELPRQLSDAETECAVRGFGAKLFEAEYEVMVS
jgi:hypothetical protein